MPTLTETSLRLAQMLSIWLHFVTKLSYQVQAPPPSPAQQFSWPWPENFLVDHHHLLLLRTLHEKKNTSRKKRQGEFLTLKGLLSPAAFTNGFTSNSDMAATLQIPPWRLLVSSLDGLWPTSSISKSLERMRSAGSVKGVQYLSWLLLRGAEATPSVNISTSLIGSVLMNLICLF